MLFTEIKQSLSVNWVKIKTGARAFHCCAPSLWTNLLLPVRSAFSLATFKRHLKTHLFNWDPPPPILDTSTHDSLLMLQDCFIDLLLATKPGFVRDIGAMEI